jgi:predicted porin
MKKTLTTLMVLALALVATSAMAGDGAWSFYGKLHTSINMIDDSANSQLGLSSNTSRIGFKGNQELNENFTFIWQIEGALNMAQKDSDWGANRNTFLGLKGTWGTALWGIHDTPYKTLGRKTTYFYDSIGDNRQVMFHTDDRNDDYLMYFSPDLSGFNFQLGYEFDQNDAGVDNAATSFAGMVSYAKNAFYVGFAYEALSKGMFYDMTDPDETGENRMRFAGKYDAEKFGIALSYQMLTDYMGVTDWKSTTFGGDAIFHASEKFDVKAGYYVINPDTEEIAGVDWGCSLLAIGVDYNYVKNVQFYLQYAGIMNQDNGDFGLGDYNGFGAPTAVAATGETVSGFSFGTAIKF